MASASPFVPAEEAKGQVLEPARGTQSSLTDPFHHVAWGLGGRGLLRYNRAEGAYAGLRAVRTVERLSLEGLVGLASTDPVPQLTVGFSFREGRRPELRVEWFHRMETVDPSTDPFGAANSLTALIAGRDEGEYYRATGAALSISASPVRRDPWTVRLYFERQAPPKSIARWSAIGWPAVGYRGRDLAPVDRLRQVGIAAAVAHGWGSERARPSLGIELRGRAETGGARLAILGATAQVRLPLPLAALGSARVGLQAAGGTVPAQRLALLGGPSRVRGFDGAARSGKDAAWVRFELVRRIPRATAFGFVDWGWAGRRDDTAATDAIASAGVGLSFLDDTVRAHLAWPLAGAGKARVAIYVNALRIQG